jgi:hypothetical protein
MQIPVIAVIPPLSLLALGYVVQLDSKRVSKSMTLEGVVSKRKSPT